MEDRLAEVRAKARRLVVGLNSGTSMDGIDAVAVAIEGAGPSARLDVRGFHKRPYDASVRADLIRAPALSCEDVCRLHRALGFEFAAAARAAAAAAGAALRDVDLVASHGQTVCHLPARDGASTLQIGDLDVIAVALGIPVVGDFRAADTAAGGAGAPLMPYLDRLLFRDAPGTVTLNLGGIACLTWLPGAGGGDPAAFDVCGANVVLDLLAARASGGRLSCDVGGALAAAGFVHEDVVAWALRHPFVRARPPKTSGREEFGHDYVGRLVAAHPAVDVVDLLASHTAFVGRAVATALREFRPPDLPQARQVVASGGGVHNPTLMRGLRDALGQVPVRTLREVGLDPDAKEAILFALLGNDRVFGIPGNIPSITGAHRAVPLGKLAIP